MTLQIGEKIRKYRREMEMTQDDLAEKLGVSFQTVSHWENGQTYPDIELLPAISRILGVSFDELLGVSDGERERQANEVLERFRKIMDAGPTDDNIIDMIRDMRRNYDSYPKFLRFLNLFDERCIRSDRVLSEFRLMAEDIIENSKNPRNRYNALVYLTVYEREDRLDGLLDRHGYVTDDTRWWLLQNRYVIRGEMDKEDIIKQERLLDRLDKLFFDYTWVKREDEGDPDILLRSAKLRFGLYNMIFGGDSVPACMGAGDEEVNCFVFKRIGLGWQLGSRLAAAGQREKALHVLEGTCALLEKAMRITGKVEITGPAPWLDGITFTFEERWNRVRGGQLEERQIDISYRGLNGKESKKFGWISPSREYAFLTGKDGEVKWPGSFDSIRDDARYQSCVERIRGLIEVRSDEPE